MTSTPITEEEREQLLDVVRQMRAVAEKVGPMHSWWDIIFDIEAILGGETPAVEQSIQEWIDEGYMLLKSAR